MLGYFDYTENSSCHQLLTVVVDRLNKVLVPTVRSNLVGQTLPNFILQNVPTYTSIEAKKNTLNSLGTILTRYYEDSAVDREGIVSSLRNGLLDYTTDERGEVGSGVRIVCMEQLAAIVLAYSRRGVLDLDFARSTVVAMIKQFCERMDNARHCAGHLLRSLTPICPIVTIK